MPLSTLDISRTYPYPRDRVPKFSPVGWIVGYRRPPHGYKGLSVHEHVSRRSETGRTSARYVVATYGGPEVRRSGRASSHRCRTLRAVPLDTAEFPEAQRSGDWARLESAGSRKSRRCPWLRSSSRHFETYRNGCVPHGQVFRFGPRQHRGKRETGQNVPTAGQYLSRMVVGRRINPRRVSRLLYGRTALKRYHEGLAAARL